jgi:predicted hydrolase (HD superfamily)
MKVLADQLDANQELWELVGILHDLDYDETGENRSKHGVIAAERLEGDLPTDGLNAIMRHDHRTGYAPVTKLDHSLIFADALSIIIQDGHLEASITMDAFQKEIDRVSASKPWLKKIIEEYPLRAEIDFLKILKLL